MHTLSARTLRFANLFALAAAVIAVCPRATLAESGGAGSTDLPIPSLVLPDGTKIYASACAAQADGSITYNNVTVTWANGATKTATWANISVSGTILFSDGTVGQI